MNNAGDLLFDLPAAKASTPRQKRPKLGRYEGVKKKLEGDADPAKIFVDFEPPKRPKDGFRFIDLFCGAGGITCGLSQAGYEPLAAVEVIDVACDTHERNFPRCKMHRGAIEDFSPRKVLGRDATKLDLVVGGPPCQGFSVAGQRDPADERNHLFREFIRVVSETRPPFVVMENVPGIITLAGGAFFRAILAAYREIGYSVSVAVLESAEYGIPQFRPRAIFIANRLGWKNPFPKPQLKPSEYVPIESALGGLPADRPIPEINHEWTKHSKEMEARLARVPPGGSLYESFFDAWKRQYPGIPSMTIKENHGGTHIHPHLNRVLSAREMARLQTFPDSFIFCGTMKKAMWQIGNAVPPRLAEVIGKALLPSLRAARDGKNDPWKASGEWRLMETPAGR